MTRFRKALSATTAAGALFAAPALAQTVPEEAHAVEAPESNSAIQDIVVTARRREESLQNAPVTVTAFTGAQLQEKGINDFARLAQATPGVNFDAFPRAAPRPFFRGIGSSNQGAGGDPSSVAFLDGVYLGRAAMLGIDFFDMQRIEVLKGPQGTLFGKNVVGGAVNFITAKPTSEAAAHAQLTAGEYSQLNGNVMLNLPITDTIATRVVLGAVTNDGFRHTPGGRSLDDENKISARVQTMVGIGTGTTFLLAGDIAKQDLGQGSHFNVRTLPFRTSGPRGYDDFDKPRVADPDRYGGINTQTGGVRGELNTDILGFATLTATAAWRTLDYTSSDDLDGSNAAANLAAGVVAPAIQTLAKENADSYSAETRLTSLGSGPFSWVFGLYYNHDRISRERESETDVVDTSENRFVAHSTNRSYAAFGEVQYKFGFGLGVFGGARYTDEKKTYDVTRLIGNPAAPTIGYTTVGTPGEAGQRLVTYRVGTDFRVNDNIFLFGTVSTGFKSGAFPEQPGSAVLARIATAPEKVTNYEAGFKTDWLDRRLRANVSAFVAKYKNFQTIQVIPDATAGPGGSRVSTDTGDATIKGVETELIFAPVDLVDLTVRYTYLDARFDQLTQTSAILADGSAVQRDLAGNRLSRTPKHAITADLGFTTPKSDWGWLRALVSMDYQSDIYDDNDNDFIEYRRARTLWDASLTYHVDDRFSAQLWVRNLTDKEYRTFQVDSANGLFVQYGPPRQIGVTLNASF
ncbi:TonB-dependent receptor [Sphingomonas sp. So64.6b]|uniref:TonB-dependent receptor n=1 Tax=Sphingomonas sp. So64.6b TaxID=2997354 RepID=UPI001603B90C|nr:TonB-dependent receptor [Sphingomonas sp. So64.6b]QNA82883.1 TonB-dependent receptor [Sphingomonas sp. So64.6b]